VERLGAGWVLGWSDAAAWLATAPRRGVWELRRFGRAVARRIGGAGIALVFGMAVAALAGWMQHVQAERLVRVQQDILVQQAQPVVRPASISGSNGRAHLAEFDAYLPAHDDIAVTVGALFSLAQREGLSIARGEYKAQPDGPGRFLRYRMTLPVQGDAGAIRRFMLAALQAHKTLALESVQFKRDRAATAEVEARIQWVLLARLPGVPGAEAAPVATAVGLVGLVGPVGPAQ
jgi:hypothetical protein